MVLAGAVLVGGALALVEDAGEVAHRGIHGGRQRAAEAQPVVHELHESVSEGGALGGGHAHAALKLPHSNLGVGEGAATRHEHDVVVGIRLAHAGALVDPGGHDVVARREGTAVGPSVDGAVEE